MAQSPIQTGAALLAVLVAAAMGTVIILAEALVRWAARINEARTAPRRPR